MKVTWPGTRTQSPSRRRSGRQAPGMVAGLVLTGVWVHVFTDHRVLGSPPRPVQCACGLLTKKSHQETPCSLQLEPSHDLHLALHPEPVALPKTASSHRTPPRPAPAHCGGTAHEKCHMPGVDPPRLLPAERLSLVNGAHYFKTPPVWFCTFRWRSFRDQKKT